MKHKLALLLMALILPVAGWPQEAADNLFSQYLPKDCYHSGQYRQEKQLNGLAQPLITEGEFVFSCRHGLIWHTRSPIIETTLYKTSGEHLLISKDSAQPLRGRAHRAVGQLLNNLIGGDTDYLQRHFYIAEANSQLTLTPKSHRLQKAVQSIHIKTAGVEPKATVEIFLQHSVSEYTHIQISERHTYSALNAESCAKMLSANAEACSALFQP